MRWMLRAYGSASSSDSDKGAWIGHGSCGRAQVHQHQGPCRPLLRPRQEAGVSPLCQSLPSRRAETTARLMQRQATEEVPTTTRV